MLTFIAGAMSTRPVWTDSGGTAKRSVDRRSSAIPEANLPMLLAVAGATTTSWAELARSTCGMPLLGRVLGKRSKATGLPESARNDSGPINLRAALVITTQTSQPALRMSRTSSSAL